MFVHCLYFLINHAGLYKVWFGGKLTLGMGYAQLFWRGPYLGIPRDNVPLCFEKCLWSWSLCPGHTRPGCPTYQSCDLGPTLLEFCLSSVKWSSPYKFAYRHGEGIPGALVNYRSDTACLWCGWGFIYLMSSHGLWVLLTSGPYSGGSRCIAGFSSFLLSFLPS